MSTLRELINDVRILVDDMTVPEEWVTGWLNDGLKKLTPLLRLERQVTTAITPTRLRYALPNDFYSVRMVKLQNESAPRRILKITDLASHGFKIWDNALTLQPMPTQNSVLELWYNRSPVLLVSMTDVPEVPEPFQNLLVWYAGASYQTYRRDAELERTIFYKHFTDGVELLNAYMMQYPTTG